MLTLEDPQNARLADMHFGGIQPYGKKHALLAGLKQAQYLVVSLIQAAPPRARPRAAVHYPQNSCTGAQMSMTRGKRLG